MTRSEPRRSSTFKERVQALLEDLRERGLLYENVFQRASDEERAQALVYLEDWRKGRRH